MISKIDLSNENNVVWSTAIITYAAGIVGISCQNSKI